MCRSTSLSIFCAILCGFYAPFNASIAQPDTTTLRLTLPQPLTADLSSEIDPCLSPDGRWLLYASNRTGSYDLWIRPASGGVPLPLTTHPADDHSPVWSPKGDKICFVSTRDDPRGDLYLLNFSIRADRPRVTGLRPVLSQPVAQSCPTFSANGKYIAYQDGSGPQARIMLLRLGKKDPKSLTPAGYIQPRFSPRNDRILCIQIAEEEYGSAISIIQLGNYKEPSPEILPAYRGSFPPMTPGWSPDGTSFCASLVNRDLDGDGFLTASDGRILYRFDLSDSLYAHRPLSIGEARESHPFWAEDGYIYFVSDRRSNSDLWRIPAEGPIPHAPSAEMGYSFALSIGQEAELEGRPLTQQEILTRLLALNRVRRDFPGQSAIGAESMLESARLLAASGALERAGTFLKRIPRLYPDQPDICAQAQIDYQMQAHNAGFSRDGDFYGENPVSFISNMQVILQEFAGHEMPSARAHYLIGSARELLGNLEGALESYNTVVDSFPEAGDHPAEALLRVAAIYSRLGSGEEALGTYLDEIRRFSNRAVPTNRAIRNVIELRVGEDDPIAGLQDLIGRYADIPALTTAAQKRIAELLAQASETELALGEYERLRGYAARHPIPYVRTLLAEGLMEAAELENDRAEFLLAQTKHEEVEEKLSDLQGGYLARKARHLRIQMLTERAEFLNLQGDWELALVNFEKALVLDPQNVRLHRGRIASAYALGRLDDITDQYRQQLQQRDDDAVLLYALGLCLSYSGEENPADLQESNALIQRAIAIQPKLAYGYLTLGYNYEQLENLTREGKKSPGNILSKSLRGIGKAFNRLARFITFRGESQPFQSYEKAIETLQLGLAVNDEAAHPELEAQMLLNLGNNYFRLGEFGYPRALTAYLQRLNYDSTFASTEQEALIRERMGQAAAITGKNDLAQINYQRSLKLYHQTKHSDAELRVLLRLAELHQVLNQEDESNSYYRRALTLADREGLTISRTKCWENMAYNALALGDDQTAISMTNEALASLPPDEEIPLRKIDNPLVLELLGIPIPIWNFGYLGTGSPTSALGFDQRDELLLNYSISQEVHSREKDVGRAQEQAFRRLAIALRRQNPEAEAILWSEIGYFTWAEGDRDLARRCFIRSLALCRQSSVKKGRLSALINLACIELNSSQRDTSRSMYEIYRADIDWLSKYNVGLPAENWEEIRRSLDHLTPGLRPEDVKKALRRSVRTGSSPGRTRSKAIDWDLVTNLLLLKDDPFPMTFHLSRTFASEIEKFRADPVGFGVERVRFYELYAQLQLKASAALPDSTPGQQLRKLETEAEALWALQTGIKEAQGRGLSELEIRLRLDLTDYLLLTGDIEGSAEELQAARQQAEEFGRDDLLWRAHWRLGRMAMIPEFSQSSEAKRSVQEWFDLAIQTWSHLPEDPNDLGALLQSKAEARLMLELAALRAFNANDTHRGLKYAQMIANLPLLEATRSRMVPVQFERRKFIWGGGGGTIPFLRREMERWRREAAGLIRGGTLDTAALSKVHQKLIGAEQEYFHTLETITREDPEFASLFSLPTFAKDTLRSALKPGDLLIQILDLEDEVHLIFLDADSFWVAKSSFGQRNLQDWRHRLLSFESEDFKKQKSLYKEFLESLFGSSLDRIRWSERVFLVVPPSWADVPFEHLLMDEDHFGRSPQIYRLPDPQSLLFLQSKPSFGKGENISFGSKENIPSFRTAADLRDQDAQNAFENAAMILLHPPSAALSHPLDRPLFASGGKIWKTSDLWGMNVRGDVMFIRGDFSDEALLVRATFFAGFSSVIFLPDDWPEDILNQFLQTFAASKKTASPGEVFYTALRSLEKSDPNELCPVRIRYYGSGGLNQQERQAFARRNFATTVLKGNYNLEQGDGEWALRYYDRALAMVEETGDSAAMVNLYQLRIKAAREIARWDEALKSQEALIDIAHCRGDERTLEIGYRNLSVYASNLGDFERAIQARSGARQMAFDRGDEIQAAFDDQILATFYENMEDYQISEAVILRAQKIFYDWGETDPYIASSIYLGRLDIIREDFASAVGKLEDLGHRIHDIQKDTGEDIALPAEYYQHLGMAYEVLTDYDRAREAQEKALSVLGDTMSAVSALTHQYLAGLYWKQGQYQNGLDQLLIAQEQFSTLGLKQYLYLAENTEALIYLSLGDPERALEKAKNALEGAILSGDLRSRSAIEKNLGLIELALGRPEKAKIRFQSSLNIDRQLDSDRGQAYAQLDLGNALLQMGQLDSARVALETALDMGKRLGEIRVQARSHLGLGLVHLNRDKPKEGRESLNQARTIAEERGLDELIWRIDLALARTFHNDGREADALQAAERAMTRVEAMRAAIAAEGLKSGFMEDKKQIYMLAAELHLEKGDIHEALQVAERSRSRTFLDLLLSRQIQRKAGLEAELETKEADLSRRMSRLRVEIDWLKAKGPQRTPEEDEQLRQYQAELDSLKEAYTRLLEEIEARHPGYRDLVTVDPAAPEQVQALLNQGESLLEYYPLTRGMIIFTATSNGIRAKTITISEDSLATLVSALRSRLARKLSVQDEAQVLYNWLIAPVEADLAGSDHLIIVPWGALHYLPFALLQDQNGDYLIDRHSLSFAPSASVFAFCRERSRSKPPSAERPFLAFGNPNTDLPQESLFFSEKEVTSIAFTFPGTEVLLRNQAQESALLQDGPDAGAVHLACHGVFEASNPIFSSLFLAPGGGEDGRLEMHEIFDLRLDRCGLVTLSACESGLGRIAGGDEIVGLTRAFIYAGSPRVISTLWKVDDLATAVLVKRFYRSLKSGVAPAAALREAQLQVRHRIHPHPAYWAAFLLTGEPSGDLGIAVVQN